MIKKIFLFLSGIAVLAALITTTILQSKVMKKSGKKEFSQIENPVKVYFDKFGIPHIDSKNIDDSYFALGYFMASERLFQMDLYRRLVQGRLSEIFGEKTIEADRLLRTLEFKKMGERMEKNLPEHSEILRLTQAYLKGVQAYLDEGNLPIEFLLLGYKPEPFEISDIIGVTGYMALTFTEGINGDIYLSELQEKLPEAKLQSLRIGDQTDRNYFGDQKIVRTKILDSINNALGEIEQIVPILHGSNSWVLSGKRTESGYPVLANDPHIGMANPHVFYEAHLRAADFELYGNYIPLIPFPVMGHTRTTAWGLTMSEVDDFNVYLEKINPDDEDQVMFKNEWVAIEKRSEVIKVKKHEDVNITIRKTPHGPLLDGTDKGVSGKSLSVSWSVYHPENNVLQSLFHIPRAETVDEFREAVSHAAAPGLNISWVHKNGDIAWWMLGKNPKLPDGVKTDLVLKGWDGTHEIERYYTIDENPHLVNPESGVIITANYRPQLTEFAHIDGYWQPGGRYFRIEKLLSQKEIWDNEGLKEIQFDNKVPIDDQLKQQLINYTKTEKISKVEAEMLEIMSKWDGHCDTESLGCSIYHAWNYYNLLNAFEDEMGKEGFLKFGKTADFWHSYKWIVFNVNDPLWDNIKTQRVESGRDIVTKSLIQAREYLQDKLGNVTSRWKWGRLHTAEYVHPLGRVKPLNYLFNIGPVPAAGGRFVINNMGHKKETNDFRAMHAPATRRIIDMGDIENSWGILPTGNSGNLMSPHFDDQLSLYHEGKYRKQLMNWNEIRQLDLVQLVPVPSMK